MLRIPHSRVQKSWKNWLEPWFPKSEREQIKNTTKTSSFGWLTWNSQEKSSVIIQHQYSFKKSSSISLFWFIFLFIEFCFVLSVFFWTSFHQIFRVFLSIFLHFLQKGLTQIDSTFIWQSYHVWKNISKFLPNLNFFFFTKLLQARWDLSFPLKNFCNLSNLSNKGED